MLKVGIGVFFEAHSLVIVVAQLLNQLRTHVCVKLVRLAEVLG